MTTLLLQEIWANDQTGPFSILHYEDYNSMGNDTEPKPQRAKSRKSRGQGLRTRSGCITCRRRHVKCDEQKPVCKLCAKSGHTCEYSEIHQPQSGSAESATPRPNSVEEDPSEQPSTATPQPSQQTSRYGQDHVTWTSGPQVHENVHSGSATAALSARNSFTNSPENTYTRTFDHISYHSGPSPESVSSRGLMPDVAVTEWYLLLAGDASVEDNGFFRAEGDISYDADALRSPNDHVQRTTSTSIWAGENLSGLSRETGVVRRASYYSYDETAGQEGTAILEKKPWQSSEPLTLLDHEHFVFQNFVKRIALWIDLFDPMKHFSTFVPHLALRNVGLLKAILALSVRHLSLNPSDAYERPHGRNDAVQYYYETLHYVQKAMQYDTYHKSLEVLATCLIISAYEMLDGSRSDWERHLEGVFKIQRSRVIHGDSIGLEAAVWWAWLSQDVWAAFREKRKVFTFWKPARRFNELNPHELACRSIFIMAHVVNYCSQSEIHAGERSIQSRVGKAEALIRTLDEWQNALTLEFSPLPLSAGDFSTQFDPIWIQPPSFAVAIQLHYSARILLSLHRPSLGGLDGFIEQQAALAKYAESICGIATVLIDEASSIMSSQCLFIAGMCMQGAERRRVVLQLIESCRQRTSWPVRPLGEELEAVWNGTRKQ